MSDGDQVVAPAGLFFYYEDFAKPLHLELFFLVDGCNGHSNRLRNCGQELVWRKT